MSEKFKTVLFGYAKRDVCEYIAKLSDVLSVKYRREIAELEEKIALLTAENERLARALDEAEKPDGYAAVNTIE